MCGRFSNQLSNLNEWSSIIKDWPKASESNNVAPTTTIPVYSKHGLHLMRWGLVPRWSVEPKPKFSTHNAKLESVDQKPTFREAWHRRRTCIIPSVGYFEWSDKFGDKQKYFVHRPDRRPVVFAGIWENWSQQDEQFSSCTILTTAAVGQLQHLHPRMPVLCSPETAIEWLEKGDLQNSQDEREALVYSQAAA